jgi:hypothetical protein
MLAHQSNVHFWKAVDGALEVLRNSYKIGLSDLA